MLKPKDIRELHTLRSFVEYGWPPCTLYIEGKICGVQYRAHNIDEIKEIIEAFSDIE